MSEIYSGTKFKTIFKEKKVLNNKKISELTKYCNKFTELGLAPFVDGGHAGNLSFRTENGFIITAAGTDLAKTSEEDFVEVINVNNSEVTVIGTKEPSSETLMHNAIYQKRPDINAIFHGHDKAVMENPQELPITEKEQPYGSLELVQEVIKLLNTLNENTNYIIIKNHGILSLGKTMEQAGNLAIETHNKAINT
jgi:ribulose-5-phosphate 4-epimerase/fuculose-1-phosphate aldolase